MLDEMPRRRFAEVRLATPDISTNHDSLDDIGVSNRLTVFQNMHFATPCLPFADAPKTTEKTILVASRTAAGCAGGCIGPASLNLYVRDVKMRSAIAVLGKSSEIP